MNTKAIIKEAAFRLFEQYPFERVTVQMILDEAGVSRRTFYDHFLDKYELMEEYFTDPSTKAVFAPDSPPAALSHQEWLVHMEAYFQMMKTRLAYFRSASHPKSADLLWSSIHGYTYEYYKNMRLNRTKAAALTETEELTIRAFVAAYNTVLKAYLEDETDLTLEQLIAIIAGMIPEDYRRY